MAAPVTGKRHPRSEYLNHRSFLPAVVLAAALWLATGVPALAGTFLVPPEDTDLVGTHIYVHTRYEETLLDVARDYGIGYEEVVRANPEVDPWIPGEGTRVLLPTRYILPEGFREGIVINLPEYRLYYFRPSTEGQAPEVVTHPISIGRMDWNTPLGSHRIVKKVKDPAWYPPESIRREHAERGDVLPKVVPAGPENPLGAYALRLDVPGYLIHGTNKPAGVGMRVTHGCIRMFPEDIERLFPTVEVGTPVQIISEPIKVGWAVETLYAEVHPPLEEHSAAQLRLNFTNMLRAAAAERGMRVDWSRAEAIFSEATGVPVEVPLIGGPSVAATH
jgi:L,D-transpeptidase ErfK/SrfK